MFNYDLPNEPESYVHRIGRTARAGRSGVAYAFCDDTESGYLVGIQQLIGKEIPVHSGHPFHFIGAIPKPGQKPGKVKTGANRKAGQEGIEISRVVGARRNPIVPAKAIVQTTIPVDDNRLTVVLVEKSFESKQQLTGFFRNALVRPNYIDSDGTSCSLHRTNLLVAP